MNRKERLDVMTKLKMFVKLIVRVHVMPGHSFQAHVAVADYVPRYGNTSVV